MTPNNTLNKVHVAECKHFFVEAAAESRCRTLCSSKVERKNQIVESRGARAPVSHRWRRQCPWRIHVQLKIDFGGQGTKTWCGACGTSFVLDRCHTCNKVARLISGIERCSILCDFDARQSRIDIGVRVWVPLRKSESLITR